MSTEHLPSTIEVEATLQWDVDAPVEAKRQQHERWFREMLAEVLRQFIADGEMRVDDGFEAVLDKFMLQSETAIAQHFARQLGREALH